MLSTSTTNPSRYHSPFSVQQRVPEYKKPKTDELVVWLHHLPEYHAQQTTRLSRMSRLSRSNSNSRSISKSLSLMTDPWLQTLAEISLPLQEELISTESPIPYIQQRLLYRPPPYVASTQSHSACIPGGDKTLLTIEDAHRVITTLNIVCDVVADGHGGMNGRVLAQLATEMVTEFTIQYDCVMPTMSQLQLEALVDQLYNDINEACRKKLCELVQGSAIDANGVVRDWYGSAVRGGSTLSTVWTFIDEDGKRVIHSANVGDSDIILVKQDKQTREVSYEHLSTDHGASNQDEYVRIQLNTKYTQKLLQCYKQCDPCDKKKFHYPRIFTPLPTNRPEDQFGDLRDQQFVINPWGNNLTPATVRYDPSAYATSPPGARDGVQIAMVRMIGDFNAQQYGAICKPSQRCIILDTDTSDHLLFTGSDGVWDCWKYEEFAEEAMRHFATSTLSECVDNLFTTTVNKAKTSFGIKGFDDITMTCTRF